MSELEHVFGRIYSDAVWGGGSGAGSTPTAAEPYVRAVKEVMSEFESPRIVDVGHGDWRMWPPGFFAGATYFGFDVAEGVSASVSAQHGSENVHFAQGDARFVELPDADVVLCKDVLQHLSNKDAERVLRRFKKFPRSVICHDVAVLRPGPDVRAGGRRGQSVQTLKHWLAGRLGLSRRRDCVSGGYRPLDITDMSTRLSKLGLVVISTFDFPGEDRDRPKRITKRVWIVESTETASAIR